MTGLVWSDSISWNWLTANGVRGVYTIQQSGIQWLLTGVHHDGLTILNHHIGKTYDTMAAANHVDTQPPAGEMSGG